MNFASLVINLSSPSPL